MIKIVTHNAKFHSDDVFGVATLFILLGKENCQVFRTRDREVIAAGDYILDVGEESDQEKNRFDHHQLGGAGARENGIEYASFGLIWKKFGEKVCGSKSVAEKLDASFVQVIDAADNGQNIIKPLIPGVHPFTMGGVIDSYRVTWKEEEKWDERFLECVEWAESFLKRLIKITGDQLEGIKIVEDEYRNAPDKRIIVINEKYDLGREIATNTLINYPEPIYSVGYRGDVGSWQVVGIRKSPDSFELRKPLPEAWGAMRDKEFEEVSGVSGALFCHRRLFMCTAQTKEAALKLANLALSA